MPLTFDRIYQKDVDSKKNSVAGIVGRDNVPLKVLKGATSHSDGVQGLVPAPDSDQRYFFLRGDGTWAIPNNSTYGNATDLSSGLMTKEDKEKLDSIEYGANKYTYTLPDASPLLKGGIRLSGEPNDVLFGDGTWKQLPSEDEDTHWISHLYVRGESRYIYNDGTEDDGGDHPYPDENDDVPSDVENEILDDDGSMGEDDDSLIPHDGEEPIEVTDVIMEYYENDELRNTYMFVGGGQTKVYTRYDGAVVIETNIESYEEMVGATEDAPGSTGMVPAPTVADCAKFLRGDGTWADVSIPTVTSENDGLMSSFDKSKLDTIESNANNYTLPAASISALGGIQISGDSSQFLNGSGEWSAPDIPTYTDATTEASGLMSAEDKAKLDSISSGANNYTYTLPAASTDALGGVQLNGDVTKFYNGNGAWTIPANTTYAKASLEDDGLLPKLPGNGEYYLNGAGNWSVPPQISYTDADGHISGLMTAEDKTKLDGIENGANNYVLPNASSSAIGGVQLSGDSSQFLSGDGTWATPTDTTYANATTASAGLMSAEDKAKLDGIEEGANRYVMSSASPTRIGGVQLSGVKSEFLAGDGDWVRPYENATTEEAGLMSAEDKAKLDSIKAGIDENTYIAASELPINGDQPIGAICFLIEE